MVSSSYLSSVPHSLRTHSLTDPWARAGRAPHFNKGPTTGTGGHATTLSCHRHAAQSPSWASSVALVRRAQAGQALLPWFSCTMSACTYGETARRIGSRMRRAPSRRADHWLQNKCCMCAPCSRAPLLSRASIARGGRQRLRDQGSSQREAGALGARSAAGGSPHDSLTRRWTRCCAQRRVRCGGRCGALPWERGFEAPSYLDSLWSLSSLRSGLRHRTLLDITSC